MQIVTNYICPPIPLRDRDWVAYEEGKEEHGVYGYGATEQEAVNELHDLLSAE